MVNVINEIIAQLREIPEFKFVSIWNNQFNYMEEGEIYSFPMPCAFLEVSADDFEILGDNYQATDLNVKIHIGHDFYNVSFTKIFLQNQAKKNIVYNISCLKTFSFGSENISFQNTFFIKLRLIK